MSDYYVREEDGTSRYVLEDGSGDLTLEGQVDTSFIPSVTVVYAPSLPEVTVPFIGSVSALYAPSFAASGQQTVVATAGTYTWLCPPGVTQIYVELFGGGGGGGGGETNTGYGGGGGGAYAARSAVPVTPGTTYTFTVGAGGGGGSGSGSGLGTNGTDSTFTGDSSTQVVAKGGTAGSVTVKGSGGSSATSVGDSGLVFSGGDGGNPGGASNGAGGGASGNRLAAGNNGDDQGAGIRHGGAGANGGGSGGDGGLNAAAVNAPSGTSPGGGGGGGADFSTPILTGGNGADGKAIISTAIIPPFIASVTVVYTPVFPVQPPFISSVTAVYTPTIPAQVNAPFIASVTVVYSPSVPEVQVPFISSNTHVWDIFSEFDPNRTFGGPGNGGEAFVIRLAANGASSTATLVTNITATARALALTGDSALPSGTPFVVTIDDEVVYIVQLSLGHYQIRLRGLSNTTAASHTAGATVTWGDSYDFAISAGEDVAHSFTADIASSGSFTYPGWLVAFDSTQAYLSGSRYPFHVTELVGVFDAGAGTSGTNRLDASQPNAISTPVGVSDNCAAALSNPALIQTDILTGDVGVVRYTNPEATVLDLGPRSVALQSWFGLKRVDTMDNDVTFTDPNGIVVDTTGAEGTYTGSVNDSWGEPVPLATGIARDASDAAGIAINTPNPVPWTTTTLVGTDRKMTYGSAGGGYDEKGWPFGVLTVRQGNRRVPFWQSWDWHNFSYVYNGFGTDDSFAQIVVNRNGIIYGPIPSVALPGPQDIDGPDAYWDDATYFVGASWYVVIFNGPYIVFGPTLGVTPGTSTPPDNPVIPVVSFPGGASGPPTIVSPGGITVEGGSGGGIEQPIVGLHVWETS